MSQQVSPEVRAMLASMGMRHPSDADAAERSDATAELHERFARAFAQVGNTRDAASARRLAQVARSSSISKRS